MSYNNFKKDEIPYFCWDRKDTINDILKRIDGAEKYKTIAWLLREAKFQDIWFFIKPQDVFNNYSKIAKYLGKNKDFWDYILGEWNELGKFKSTY